MDNAKVNNSNVNETGTETGTASNSNVSNSGGTPSEKGFCPPPIKGVNDAPSGAPNASNIAGANVSGATLEVGSSSGTPNATDPIEELKKLGIEDAFAKGIVESLGITSMEDLALLTEDDLVSEGVKKIHARKIVSTFKAKAVSQASNPKTTPVMTGPSYDSILPQIVNYEGWLKSMQVGGALHINEESYVSAIRCFYADCAGLYQIEDKLKEKMEQTADELEVPLSPTYYKINNNLKRRDYADLFAAFEGAVNGRSITETKRKEFLGRLRAELFPKIKESYNELNVYAEKSRMAKNESGVIASSFSSVISAMMNNGKTTPVAAAGVMLPPCDSVIDACKTLKDAINRVFRGWGVPVSAAMAYDASRIAKLLDDPELPALVGAEDKDRMLKKLGANVTPNYIRQESNMIRFVLGMLNFDGPIPVDDDTYLMALWQLGAQINWDLVGLNAGGASGLASVGGNTVL